jgi:RimJ/RimL family protein N-acetyltransferase
MVPAPPPCEDQPPWSLPSEHEADTEVHDMLVGEEVTLRPFLPDDLAKIGEWINSPRAYGPYTGFRFRSIRDLEKQFDEDGLIGADRAHLVAGAGDVEVCGLASMWAPVPGFEIREVQVLVPDPELRKTDVESRMLRALTHYIFCSFAVNRVQAHAVAADERTREVLEAAGMTREGTLKGTYLLNGKYEDESIFALIRSEWESHGHYAKLREIFLQQPEPSHGSFGFVRDKRK